METLIKENEKLVHQVINSLFFIPDGADREDLEQIGKVALWNAINSYNENSRYSFATHCYKRIYTDIVVYLRKLLAKKRKKVIWDEGIAEDFSNELIGSLLIEEVRKLLSKEDSNMFLDKAIGDMSFDQLSNKYGLSKMKIRYRLNKSRQILRSNIVWEGACEQK